MKIVSVGEAMIELSHAAGNCAVHYGGDVLNTSIHLCRAGFHVAFFTAIGTDPLSARAKASWQAEGLDVSLVLPHPRRNIGIYSISTDAEGERSFSYWRDTSAARDMMALADAEAALEQARRADCLYFSLISLAILPEDGRGKLLAAARQVRAGGGDVVFDGNYRARLWESRDEARHWRDEAIRTATIGLPTLEDECEIVPGRSAGQVMSHWSGLGCREVIVKLGEHGCLLSDGSWVRPPVRLNPVDTSGAGDAFNAGYLSARLRGAGVLESAETGHRLAGRIIMLPGAIPALTE